MKEKKETKGRDFINEKSNIFGANLRAVRKQRGFTTESLAKFLGISTAYIGLIERGERCPSLETFLKVCEFFGESPEKMLTASGMGLAMRESKSAARNVDAEETARKHKMVLSMLDTFDPAELDHVVSMMKSFKDYTDSRKGEYIGIKN